MFGFTSAFSKAFQGHAGTFRVQPRFDAFSQAQRVHQEFERHFVVGQRFLASLEAFRRIQVILRQAGFPGADNAPVRVTELAVGTGTDADEVAKTPVVEVVSRRATGQGIGRDFVLCVTVFGQQRLPGLLDVPQRVVFRQCRRLVPEHRVRFQGQLIPRQVCRFQGDGCAQVGQGIVQGLIRQAMHQVQVEVIEAGLPRHAGGTYGFVAIVNPAQGLEFFLLEALDADRQAVDPQFPVRHELVLLERTRIGFQRDFDVAGKGDALFDAFEQATQGIGTEQARRATTKEDRAQFTAMDGVQVLVEIGQQRVDILLFRQHRAGGVGVEVAIRAFAHTPRDVDVQRQGRQHRQCRPGR
ncbi:hypothetical protein D3C73_838310 [compost metagenome]